MDRLISVRVTRTMSVETFRCESVLQYLGEFVGMVLKTDGLLTGQPERRLLRHGMQNTVFQFRTKCLSCFIEIAVSNEFSSHLSEAEFLLSQHLPDGFHTTLESSPVFNELS